MSYAVDYSGDWAAIEGVEAVTYAPRNPTAADVSSVQVLRGELGRRELSFASTLGIAPGDVVFDLWAATLPSHEPKSDDRFTDSGGVVWIVIAMLARNAVLNTYRLLCRRAA